MVQVPVHEVVDVVTVGDGGMPAAPAVGVSGIVVTAGMTAGAVGRVVGADAQPVLVDVSVGLDVVQVPVVHVVDVVLVDHRRMPAPRTVLMVDVVGVLVGVLVADRVPAAAEAENGAERHRRQG
jgi:hypothetical protein